MGIEDRDYIRGEHPPTCTCKECVEKRLESKQSHFSSTRTTSNNYTPNNKGYKNPVQPSGNQNKPIRYPAWLFVLVLLFAFSLIGFAISYFTGTFILFWLLFGGSIIYSIEHWYYQQTRRHRDIGKVYRILINLSFLSLLTLVIWSGFHLFNQSFHSSPIIGVIIFIIEIVVFLWLFKVVNRNKWRWPSMKLTMFSLMCLLVVFAYAGVQPLSKYKDETITRINHVFTTSQAALITNEPSQPLPTLTSVDTKPSQTQVTTTTVMENDYANMFNQFRQSNGLQALTFTDDLNRVAELRLQELKTDYSHHSAGNYNQHLGENIAMSTGALNNSSALNLWKNSPGHKANMLGKTYKYTGYAIYDGGFWGGAFAVQVFSEFETINGVPQLPPGWYWSK